MIARKLMWGMGVVLVVAGGASAQGPGCAPGVPCASPAAPCACPSQATCCVVVKGPKKCCLFNRLLDRLAIHERCRVPVPCPAPVCAAPRCRCRCKARPTCCVEPACAPPHDAPALVPVPTPPVGPAMLPKVGAALRPVEGMASAPAAGPTMEAERASPDADAQASRQMQEQQFGTMAAIRAMQENEARVIARIEALIRPAAKTHEAAKPAEANASAAEQLETLKRRIGDLNRELQQMSHKVDQTRK